jgi:hypothetical protein
MSNTGSAASPKFESEPDCPWPCKHHPFAPQYPYGNVTPHLETISEFVTAVAEGLSRVAFPRSQQQYSKVHVLLISWVEDDLGTAEDLLHLKQIFEDTYNFSTNHFKVPSEDPEFFLDEIIASTKAAHGRNDDGLLIIYYGGHGEIDKSTQHSIWKAWKFPPKRDSAASSPQLDWSDLQDSVMKSKGDVFFILDCCYAAGAVQKSVQRRNFLLASGNDKASNVNTLTKAIIYELKKLNARPCTVFSLHYQLVANRSIHKWNTVPIHIGERRIVLAPLADPAASTSSESQELALVDQEIIKNEPMCRVLVAVTLTRIGLPSAQDAWVEWIRDHAPPNIVAVEFLDIVAPVAALSTDSNFLILTLPVSVWNAMTPNGAIKFLSIVYSPNLLYNSLLPHKGSQGTNGDKRLRKNAHETSGLRQLLDKDRLAGHVANLANRLKSREYIVVLLALLSVLLSLASILSTVGVAYVEHL